MFITKKDIETIEKLFKTNYQDIDKRLDNIEKVLLAQEINLKEHMRRSDSLEKLINNIQEKEIKPISKHVNMVEGALKFIGLIGIVSSIIATILKLFNII